MRYLIPLLLLIGLIGCEKQCPEPEVMFPAAMLPKTFKDGTKVDKVYVEDEYLYREGHTSEKDCRLSRTKVELVEKHLMFRMSGVTESCSGTTCTHCEFKDGGGCNCKNIAQGICTHTITKNREILRLR